MLEGDWGMTHTCNVVDADGHILEPWVCGAAT
jgi:hypothetical protein